ncbi:MAG: TonB-dependent receptor [Flavobacteriales bacterium]|nr:TonB-dependent receptor [Flavobacteriales bacterium]
MRKGIFIILLSILSTFAFSQSATLKGVIKNSSGESVPGVIITCKEFPTIGTSSDNRGYFSLQLKSETTLTILFKGLGDEPVQNVFYLNNGDVKEVEVLLDNSLTTTTFEIFDKGKREGGFREIELKLPTRLPVMNQGIEGYLIQAAVNMPSELSSSYSVRGGSFDENLVYVNDIQVYRPFLVRSGQQEGMSFPNPDMVSSINFSAGGFQAKYGDKMSSVLDIQYARPDSLSGNFQAGFLGTQLQLGGCNKKGTFTHNSGFRYKNYAYALNSLDVAGDYKPRFNDFQTYLTYRPKTKYGPWEFSFLGNYSSNRYNFIPQTRQTDVGSINEALRLTVYFEGQEISKYDTYFGAFSTRYNPNEHSQLRLTFSAFNTLESEKFDILGAYRLDELDRDLGSDKFGSVLTNRGVGAFLEHARNELNAQVYQVAHKGFVDYVKQHHLLEWGFDANIEHINDVLSEWTLVDSAGYATQHPRDSIGYTNPNAQGNQIIPIQDRVKANNQITSNRVNAFVQDTWRHSMQNGATLTATAGVRANHWTFTDQTVVSPRINVAYNPTWIKQRLNERGNLDSLRKDIIIRAAAGYYYQPPFYREMRGFDGQVNPNIRAQKSIHYVLGADYVFNSWGRPFKLVTELYYKKMDNIIPYELENVRQRYFAVNNAKGYAYGTDVMVNGEFIPGVQSWFRMSYLKTMEDINNDSYNIYLNSDGDTIYNGYTLNDVPVDSITQYPGYVPRPTDQRVSVSLLFLDEMPNHEEYKVMLNFYFATGLPYGTPDQQRYNDVFRTRAYLRADLGLSRDMFVKRKNKFFDSGNIALEIFNLMGVNNIINHQWIEDVNGRQYGIPTYLTGRRINLRMTLSF